MRETRHGLAQLARRALAALLPPLCPGCKLALSVGQGLCPACWSKLRFISAPLCQTCGTPFEYDQGALTLCAGCAVTPPILASARSALVYDDGSKGLVLAFKHADRLELAPLFARLICASGSSLLQSAEMILPVPLHWTRFLSRRANQSAELARHVAAMAGKSFRPDLLQRIKRTPSQGAVGGAAGRRRNVAKAFAVPPKRAPALQARHILLIDDVWTTGATLEACARVLLNAGARQVSAVTLARVVRPENLSV
jgi:ComF family protein